MFKLFNKIGNQHVRLLNIMVVVISVATILYALPQHIKFKYEIESVKGKPWPHEDLSAPFDFAIIKDAEQINKEKQKILLDSKPYYMLKESVLEEVNAELVDKFPIKLDSAEDQSVLDKLFKRAQKDLRNKRTLSVGMEIAKTIYRTGIVKLESEHESKEKVYLVTKSVAKSTRVNNLFTISSAQQYIVKSLAKYNSIKKEDLENILLNSLEENVFFDKGKTEGDLNESLRNILPTYGKILKGQTIVESGEIVDAEKYRVLTSLRGQYQGASSSSNSLFVLLGQFIIVGSIFLALYLFIQLWYVDILNDNTRFIFLFLSITLVTCSGILIDGLDRLSVYIFPFSILLITIRTFYDARVAMYFYFSSILMIAVNLNSSFEFINIQMITGTFVLFSFFNTKKRSQIFLTALIVLISYCAIYTAIELFQEGTLVNIDLYHYLWFAVSAVLMLITFPLIYVMEKLFGFISDVSLLELSDTNSRLLRELSKKAPGTFQHSLQVANMAEEVVHQIGGNTLLTRTGALYHDIGKTAMPSYFIENQKGGINPHNELGFEESASIIIAHVTEGVKMAKKERLPEQIIDFIRTHHGTTTTLYFFNMYKKESPEEEVSKEQFSYPGPMPFSKETAVLMMADSVEAASRTLKSYTEETVSNLVDTIINSQIDAGQFKNANITFKDIEKTKRIFKKIIMNIYHVRVEYPR